MKFKARNLHYAEATGPWQKREWKSIAADLKDGRVVAKLPRCTTRLCVNPTPLWVGTQADGVKLMASRGRQARGEKLRRSRLTADDVRRVQEMRAAGSTLAEIGERLGISATFASGILTGRRLSYLTTPENRRTPTRCRRRSKLTDAQVAEMRAMHAAGRPGREIAARFGISVHYVQHIVTGMALAHMGRTLPVHPCG